GRTNYKAVSISNVLPQGFPQVPGAASLRPRFRVGGDTVQEVTRMGGDSFVHLHTHSEYSLLDGASRVKELVGKASQLEMPAIAITDHGVMFGALDFYSAARDAGVKPIVGVEAYVAPGSRFDRERGDDDEAYRHLTLFARSDTGYRNLLKIVSDASIQGFYHRPRTDKEFLAEHADGITALSGCLASETARLALAGHTDRARAVVGEYRD